MEYRKKKQKKIQAWVATTIVELFSTLKVVQETTKSKAKVKFLFIWF
jgi:hypothetical protein